MPKKPRYDKNKAPAQIKATNELLNKIDFKNITQIVFDYSQKSKEDRQSEILGFNFIYSHLSQLEKNRIMQGFKQIDNLNLIQVELDERIDIDYYLSNEFKTKPIMAKNTVKKEIANAPEKKEIEINQTPFFSFEKIGEKFVGTITGVKKVKFAASEPEKDVYTAIDSSDNEEVQLPTNVQLNTKLGIATANGFPVDVEIEYLGTVKTANGQAKQFKVLA